MLLYALMHTATQRSGRASTTFIFFILYILLYSYILDRWTNIKQLIVNINTEIPQNQYQ